MAPAKTDASPSLAALADEELNKLRLVAGGHHGESSSRDEALVRDIEGLEMLWERAQEYVTYDSAGTKLALSDVFEDALRNLGNTAEVAKTELLKTESRCASGRAGLLKFLRRHRSNVLGAGASRDTAASTEPAALTCLPVSAAPEILSDVRGVALGAFTLSPPMESRRFLDLSMFDHSDTCCSTVGAAVAAVKARCEAQAHVTNSNVKEELVRLRAEIDEAAEEERREEQKHEELVLKLTARLEEARSKLHNPAAGFAASAAAAAAAEASTAPAPAAPRNKRLEKSRQKFLDDDAASSHGGGSESLVSASTSANVGLIAAKGAADAEATEDRCATTSVERFGTLFVGQLSLSSYPTRPAKYSSCISRRHLGAAPRVARCVEDAVGQGSVWHCENSSFPTDSLLY